MDVKAFADKEYQEEPCGGCARASRGKNDVGKFSYVSHSTDETDPTHYSVLLRCEKCGGPKTLMLSKEAVSGG